MNPGDFLGGVMSGKTGTPFGRELRKLRIDLGEILMDMAKKLEVTPAYLSSIENGKREIPENLLEKLCKSYHFSEEQLRELKRAKAETQQKIVVQMAPNYAENREVYETALLFARDFSKLDEKKLKQLQEILASAEASQ